MRTFTARFQPVDEFDLVVANAVARHSGARAKAFETAQKVNALAKANLSSVAPPSNGARNLKDKVLAETQIKDAGRVFQRKRRQPIGSEIPVYLVISDFWAAQWFEWGRGGSKANFPATRFMSIAKRAAKSVGMVSR